MQEIKNWWKEVRLDDIFEITSSKRIYFNEYTENGIPFYRSKEIIQKYNNQDINEILYITEDKFFEIKNKFWAPKEDDILLTAVWTLWIPYLVKKSDKFYFKDGNLIWFRNSKNEIINSKYFYFWIISDLWKESLKSITIWSSQSAYTIVWIKSLEILLPPLPTQQKIASILCKYDDLIENNNKRIKILEETAQAVYEEWFVKYKFPWSENIKMIDSGNDDFGMIPEGWEMKKVEEISLIVSKWPSLNYVDDKSQWIPVINQKCIRNWEIELNTIQFAEKLKDDKSYCYLEKYDILINSMWTWTLWRVSRNLTIDEKYIIHNCISFVRSNQNKLKQTVLYYQIKSKENHFISLSTWSTWQTTLNIKEIKNVDLIIPDIKIQNNFDNIVIKMFDEIWALKKQNQNLKETRDLLIPRLVSGELDVESLDVK